MGNFDEYSHYYDLLYKDKDYKAESIYVNNLIKRYCHSAETLLELGSGSGAHAQYLSALGYKITGIERSVKMAAISSSKRIDHFEVITGDISNTKINKTFDVAISLFHVISYLTENKSLISCFRNVYQHLNDSGLFIFDIWYSPAVYFLKPEIRKKKFENEEIRVTRISEPRIRYNDNIVEVQFESIIENKSTGQVSYLNECHPMRHFSIPEIEVIATHTGFEIVKAEEFFYAGEPSEKTWGVCFILKKKANA